MILTNASPDVSRRRVGGDDEPFEYQCKGRQDILGQKHRVTNWREYDAALRNRGSLTIWFTEEALADWKAQPRRTPGDQRHCSDLAIETTLTLQVVFRMALRQTEGLIGSVMRMLEIDLPVPGHTTLSRPACGLPDQICRPAAKSACQNHRSAMQGIAAGANRINIAPRRDQHVLAIETRVSDHFGVRFPEFYRRLLRRGSVAFIVWQRDRALRSFDP